MIHSPVLIKWVCQVKCVSFGFLSAAITAAGFTMKFTR